LNGLKQLRDRRLLTQSQVASMSGVSVATLSRIENGRVVPKYKTLRAIAQSLGLPIETVREAILSEQSSFLQ
jgi:transcriptional regulator with XRE-family HTH domain